MSGMFDAQEPTAEPAGEYQVSDRLPEDASLLIVDDDEPLRRRLGRAMERRGFTPDLAASVAEAKQMAKSRPPAFAVVDLRLGDGDGLEVVNAIHEVREDCRVVIMTGYGNIATAVAAVKAGAIDYLPKPAAAPPPCDEAPVFRDEARRTLLIWQGLPRTLPRPRIWCVSGPARSWP